MAGGQGSRLRPLTEHIPKPMAPVLGRPIMEYIVRHLAGFGIQEMVSTLHYRPHAIRDYFEDGSELGIRMHYTLEKEPLGTAGSVKLGQKLLDETFLVVGGDALMDFDFNAFLAFHREKGAKVSLCMVRVRDPGEFGIVITDEESRVQRFLEKPGPAEVFSDTVNTGIYLIEPGVLEQIPSDTPFDFANDLFPALMEQGESIYGYVAEGYWSDIGTLDQLRQAHWDLLDGKVQLPIAGALVEERLWVGEGTKIASDANITGPCWLGDNVQVRNGVSLGPYAALGNNVEVDRHANLNRAIVMRNSFVGERVSLRNCILGDRNIVGPDCEVGEDCVVGPGCHLGQRVVLRAGVLVWPDKEIDAGSVLTENLVWESLSRPSIFGSRGISGVANLHITPEFAAVIGKSFGTWVKKGRSIAISRDNHPFSRLIKRAIVSGLLAVGVDVEDLEESSTPMTRFLVGYARSLSGGLHVCIPDARPQIARIEMFNDEGLPLTRDARRKIEATFHRADFPKVSMDQVGQLSYPGRVFERYFDYLVEHIDLSAIKRCADRVIYHADDDISIRVMDRVLSDSGVSSLRAGLMTSGNAEEQTRRFSETARLNNALGLMIQRGSEQLQLVDESGALLTSERTIELLTAAFIMSGASDEAVFLPSDCPAFILAMAKDYDRNVVLTRMEPASRLAEATSYAGRETEWLEFTHYYLDFDALAGALRLLEFLGGKGTSLHDFHREIPVSYRKSLVIPCSWDEMGRVMREITHLPEADLTAAPEGVRISHEQGSYYVLPSADDPELLVSVEAFDINTLPTLAEDVTRQLQRLIT